MSILLSRLQKILLLRSRIFFVFLLKLLSISNSGLVLFVCLFSSFFSCTFKSSAEYRLVGIFSNFIAVEPGDPSKS